MKKSGLTSFLLVILVGSSLVSVLFCGLYIRNAMRSRDLQRSIAAAQNYRGLFASLVTDTLEYSKRNQAIDPILEAAGLKPPKTGPAATTNKSAGR